MCFNFKRTIIIYITIISGTKIVFEKKKKKIHLLQGPNKQTHKLVSGEADDFDHSVLGGLLEGGAGLVPRSGAAAVAVTKADI
jgi:hypothetical protein